MKNSLMSVKNLTDTSAELYMYGDIESRKFEDSDTVPEEVRDTLNRVKDVEQLNIYINSAGGDVFAGLAIYNMLKRHKGKKTVYVDGLAASMASAIALAGDKVIIPSNAFLMIHKPWSVAVGNANDFIKMAEDLEEIESGILNIYEENLAEGADMEEVKRMVANETWLNGNEAAKYFNVEVVEENRIAACASDFLDKYYHVPDGLKAKAPSEPKPLDEKLKIQNELDLLEL